MKSFFFPGVYFHSFYRVNETFKVPFFALALPMAVLLLAVVIILEIFWNYEKDIENIGVSIFNICPDLW